MFTKIKNFVRNRKKTSIFIALLLVGGIVYFISKGDAGLGGEIVRAQVGTVEQEVSATGRVKAAQSVELAFDRSGRVVSVNVQAGSRVSTGQTLVQLESSELIAQRQRAVASLNSAQQRLEQAISLSDNSSPSSDNLAVSQASKALDSAIDSMIDYTSVQYIYFNNYTSQANKISDAKEQILKNIYGQSNLARVEASYFLPLSSGLKGKVELAENNPQSINIDSLIAEARAAVLQTKNGLELLESILAGESGAIQTDKALIAANIDVLENELDNLTSQRQSVDSENFEIEIAKNQVEEAKAGLALIDAQIAKNSLRAPFSGTVTKVDVEQGEIISGGPVVSMIGSGKFEIEVNISEADIAKIKVGQNGDATLDAYSSEQKFPVSVVHIDPAAQVIDGVATYRVVLQFTNPDGRILPGLTADIDIKTEKKDDVLYVPSRDVYMKDGKRFVKVVVPVKGEIDARFANLSTLTETKENKVFEVEVGAGLRGSDGRMEIVSGIKEGDEILSD